MSACYTHRTSDEDLLPFNEPQDAAVDAAVPDASAPAPRCAGADPISLLLCNLSQPAPAASPTPDLATLLGSLGGLANIAQVLGPILGTTPRSGAEQPSPLLGLVDLAGGLTNIAQLLNGLFGGLTTGQPSLGDLVPAFTNPTASTAPPSLADLLAGFGLPVQQPAPVVTRETTPDECADAATPVVRFLCMLQQASAQ